MLFRSVMMGILPLQYIDGESAETHGLTGEETIDIILKKNIKPGDMAEVIASSRDGKTITFKTRIRFDSVVDMEYYRHGGILQMVLRQKIAE